MKPYRLKVKTLLTISGIISLLVFASVLHIWEHEDTKKLCKILLHTGLLILPISFLWWLLEKFGWHWSLIQKNRSSLNIPPDFRGRWEGTILREGESDPYKFVVEIRQTLSKVWVNTYSHRSTSQSSIAEIATDDSEGNFMLCFLWQGDDAEIPQRNIPKGIFHGYSLLQLYENETPKKLSGPYFTDREPQTKGKIELNWISFELKTKYE